MLQSLDRRLARLETKIDNLLLQGNTNMSALTDLQAAVAAETTVEASAVTLINGIPALIAAAGTDPAALAALQASITSSSSALAAAVTQNTPAAPPATGARR
jgi:hypothetical protein